MHFRLWTLLVICGLLLIEQRIANPSYKVYFQLASGSKEFSLWADFGFELILLETSFECIPTTSCKIDDPSEKTDNYKGQPYVFRPATLSILVANQQGLQPIKRDVRVRLTSLDFSVVGLNESTSLNSIYLPDSVLSISFLTGQMAFTNQDLKFLYPLDSYVSSDKSSFFYIKSKLSYTKMDVSYSNKANLCFQGQKVNTISDYFIASDVKFTTDWDFFRAQIKFANDDFSQYTFQIEPLNSQHGTFIVPYDHNIFDSYDRKPMKMIAKQTNAFCDVFVGDFFVHRSSLTIHLQANQEGKSRAYISVNVQPYHNFKGAPWGFIAFIAIFVLIFIAGSYFYGNKDDSNDEDASYKEFMSEYY